jgi:hypothetical protein
VAVARILDHRPAVCLSTHKVLAPCTRVLEMPVKSRSYFQEMPLTLLHPKVHYRVHNSRRRSIFLNEINAFHTPKHCFYKIQFNIILHLHPCLPRFSCPRMPLKCLTFLIANVRSTCPALLILLYFFYPSNV